MAQPVSKSLEQIFQCEVKHINVSVDAWGNSDFPGVCRANYRIMLERKDPVIDLDMFPYGTTRYSYEPHFDTNLTFLSIEVHGESYEEIEKQFELKAKSMYQRFSEQFNEQLEAYDAGN